MNFLCPHGYMRADCTACLTIDDAVADYMGVPEVDEMTNEYLYDYHLDEDERMLREMEEN